MSEPALVIGSGPNGLAGAIRLAEAGLSVTVLEAAAHPGGAVRTEELTLPGFRHDTFSSVYPAAAASPVFARMPLAQHGLEWVHPQACMAHPLPDGGAVALYRSVEETAASLDREHAGDGRSWTEFVAPYLRAFAAVRATMFTGFPPLRGPAMLVWKAGPRASVQLGLMLATSARTLGRRLFEGQAARAWLYGAAAHGDTPVTSPGSAMAAFYLNLLGHGAGWPSPRGGAGRLTDALVGYLHSLGGEIHTGAQVERILTRGGRVRGVGVAGGEELSASLLLADVMPDQLVRMTDGTLASWYRRLLAGYRYGPATVKLDWALDGPIPWTAPEARGAGTVHVGGDEDATAASLTQAHTGLAARPFLLLGQQSVADPTRAPEGKHTAWAYTHAPASMREALGSERCAEAIEAQVERFAPGLSRAHPRPSHARARRL